MAEKFWSMNIIVMSLLVVGIPGPKVTGWMNLATVMDLKLMMSLTPLHMIRGMPLSYNFV